jgi:hypothetical protein
MPIPAPRNIKELFGTDLDWVEIVEHSDGSSTIRVRDLLIYPMRDGFDIRCSPPVAIEGERELSSIYVRQLSGAERCIVPMTTTLEFVDRSIVPTHGRPYQVVVKDGQREIVDGEEVHTVLARVTAAKYVICEPQDADE